MRSLALPVLSCTALLMATAAPASPKPCRDQNGKTVVCAKPKPQAKPTPVRCKDEKGRFVACKTPTPAAHN